VLAVAASPGNRIDKAPKRNNIPADFLIGVRKLEPEINLFLSDSCEVDNSRVKFFVRIDVDAPFYQPFLGLAMTYPT